MRYLFFVYSDPSVAERPMEEWIAFHTKHGGDKGGMYLAERLHPVANARTVRQENTLEGSPVDSKEFISGIYIFDCDDMATALQIASECPATKTGAVEVRPIFTPPSAE